MFACSAETQDDHGNWVPCAVKFQLYFETHIKEIVDNEVAVLETMTGSVHALTLMSHGTALVEGQTHKYIATRWAIYTYVCHLYHTLRMYMRSITLCTHAQCISGVAVSAATAQCCRYLETVDMESMLSADLAMATGENLDKRLSAILVAFEGIIQVSET